MGKKNQETYTLDFWEFSERQKYTEQCPQPFWHQGLVSWKTGFFFHGPGMRWRIQDDSSTLHVLCDWIHQLYLRSSDIGSQRLGTPDLEDWLSLGAGPHLESFWFSVSEVVLQSLSRVCLWDPVDSTLKWSMGVCILDECPSGATSAGQRTRFSVPVLLIYP